MNYAIILAGGTGQRMRTSGMPKQFLPVYGKPIIVYTLETFQYNENIDEIIIPCNEGWLPEMKKIVKANGLSKVKHIVVGGCDRNHSILNGLSAISKEFTKDDIVVIHDGVRPLVKSETLDKNVQIAKEKGNAMTVKQNIETVVVTETDYAHMSDFKDRRYTYTLTAPQSFRALELIDVLSQMEKMNSVEGAIPILDVSLAYAHLGKEVYLVIEDGLNLKITTPEDYYYLKSYLELQESKHILGV